MRRYDMDWLRVIVFGLLIFYHVGMFFVPWGWHIKNNVIYDWPRWPMLFLNQWRLPILFVISGMGTYYALGKRTSILFIWERIKRLFLPLVFGMLVIVPPQVYIEKLSKGKLDMSYFEFWPALAFDGVYPVGNLSWHHLWFLPYLLVYSILLLPVFLYLRKHSDTGFIRWIKRKTANVSGIFLFIIPLYLLESLVEPFFPTRHNLTDDWFTFSNFLVFFLFGYLLITAKEEFWRNVQLNRRFYLYCGIVGFTLMVGLRILYEDSVPVHFIEAAFKVFNLWSWILVLFGYAAQYLNKPSAILDYCNRAVYPFYILHQTITIIIGYWIMNVEWPLLVKGSIMVIGTFGASWLIYETLIRRWGIIRPLFGVK
jgi:glucans biosynthesis protein C